MDKPTGLGVPRLRISLVPAADKIASRLGMFGNDRLRLMDEVEKSG